MFYLIILNLSIVRKNLLSDVGDGSSTSLAANSNFASGIGSEATNSFFTEDPAEFAISNQICSKRKNARFNKYDDDFIINK